MSLEVENRDDKEFTFEEALHTYFTVSDIAGVPISGLERTPYLDKVGGSHRANTGRYADPVHRRNRSRVPGHDRRPARSTTPA